MSAVVEINLQEIEKLARKINAYALTPSQKRGLLKSLGKVVEEQTEERFDTKRDPDGDKWRDITEAYRKFLMRPPEGKHPDYRGAQPPLIREGGLRDSIENQLQGSDSVLIGAASEYADYHQSAKKEKRRRKFLGLGVDDIIELQDAVDEFMEARLK